MMYKTILKIHTHIKCVREALSIIIGNLQKRADSHDDSKFRPDELEYYSAYEKLPEGLVFGSEEYKQALKDLNVGVGTPGFLMHSNRNDHHPEYYFTLSNMRFDAIIEMVCDWHGAMRAYGNKQDWMESVEYNISRFDFNDNQIWLIRQVAEMLKESQ